MTNNIKTATIQVKKTISHYGFFSDDCQWELIND